MILHAIELTHVGPFRETMRLGPFAPGLNLLCAPNESGKSTAIRAAARTLFDRHTTKGDELKAFQPAGTDLAPRIAVEFETRSGRFRIEKTFLQSPRSLLKEWQSSAWQPIAEADLADQRVQGLLSSSLPGKGATKPEHWGFLGFLWARQGEPVDWPRLEDAAVGQRIRARLARIELDPVIEQLRNRLAAAADAIFTSKGFPKANGPLEIAEKDLASIETDYATLRQTRANLDSAQQRYSHANAKVAQLEKEHTDREHAASIAREQALAAERLRGELEARQLALATAQEKLAAAAADSETIVKRREEIIAAKIALAKAETAAQVAEARVAQLRIQLDEQQAARPTHESQLNALRADHQRLQSLIKLRELIANAGVLARQVAKAENAAAEVTALEAKKAKLPTLTAAKLRKLEELAESVRTLHAQLQALGLTVELTPDRAKSIVINDGTAPHDQTLPADKTTRLHSPRSLDLQLAGWGHILIRSGAQDAQDAADRLAETETALREMLQEAEVASVDAGREAVAARKDFEAQIKAATIALTTQLGDYESLADLREAAASANRRVETLTTTVQPTAEEQARSLTNVETSEAQLAETVPAAEKAFKAFDQKLDRQRTEEREAAKSVQEATQVASDHRSHLRTLETQIDDLTGRYPEGIETAKKAAQLSFAQAEARVTATQTQLPLDFEKLPERNKRAAAALQQLSNELQACRAERDQAKGTLETLGGQGLYSRETDIEEKKAEATLRRDAARAQGWSARIAHDLIEYRKQAATKAVLTPLEQRLTAAFAELTGDASREVFLDEHLQLAGIGRTRDHAYAFESLSQGAKEQLLLCLRIAVAQELATEEPQVLILDDVLANTDSVRQERVLDVLGALSVKLQILVLTCHADRYRGAGTPLALLPSTM
jgi:hypothetical protein